MEGILIHVVVCGFGSATSRVNYIYKRVVVVGLWKKNNCINIYMRVKTKKIIKG